MTAARWPRPRGLVTAATALGLGALAGAGAIRFGAEAAIVPSALGLLGVLVAALVAARPHVALAAIIPVFTLMPTVNHVTGDATGGLKDLVVLAVVAGAAVASRRGTASPDPWVLTLAGLLALMYVVNPFGPHDAQWATATRLVAEPLALLVVGLGLRGAERNLRWASISLIATGVAVALVGVAQQALGVDRLVALGFTYGEQVRSVDGNLRSFGTLGEPFSYAAIVLMALALVTLRRGARPLALTLGVVLSAGLAASLVRTAALVGAALVGVALFRQGRVPLAALLATAALVGGLAIVVAPPDARTTDRVTRTGTVEVALNGRADAWSTVVSSPRELVAGHGVGRIGTAAQRFERNAAPGEPTRSVAVDSGYLAVVADLGLPGLVVLLALLARLATLAVRGARQGSDAGWMAVGLLAVLVLDAATRSSLTAFPTAYVGLLVVGSALAACRPPAGPA